ncbi:MAG TPA: ribokinase [Candidatus Marinimicrobia bacterium]|nr:ribokinase [Candidatus Neomarinimicrobiota bacterium]
MGIVSVVGSFVYDLVAKAPRRPKTGETLIGESFGMFLGGKGANQAIASSRSGASVHMIGRLGNDLFGNQFLEKFSNEGISTDFVVIDDVNGTGVGMPLIDATGDNSIVLIPQANMALSVDDVNNAFEPIASSDVLILQLEVPIDASQRAAEIAKENNTMVLLNPAPAREIPDSFLRLVDVLIPNEIETEILSGMKTTTNDQAIEAARALTSKGISTVILTLGHRGALLLTDEIEKRVPGFAIEAVDTTAAGDAFCGALATSLAQGSTIEDAVWVANAAGALAVTKLGAEPSLPKKADLDQFLAVN